MCHEKNQSNVYVEGLFVVVFNHVRLFRKQSYWSSNPM